jgi:small neutral amino acid transporter SnatA (MarC family)
VKSVRTRLVSLVALTMGALLVLATPAGAAPAGASTGVVLADEQFKWFYWIGIVLAVSMALWLIATLVGYYLRVMRPKYRGRDQS